MTKYTMARAIANEKSHYGLQAWDEWFKDCMKMKKQDLENHYKLIFKNV